MLTSVGESLLDDWNVDIFKDWSGPMINISGLFWS